jgi:23S rRNA (guanosine2251-2'-O)-methyltransferase
MIKDTIFIYGKNAVLGALRNRPDTVERVFLEKGKVVDKNVEKEMGEILSSRQIPKEIFIHQDISRDLQTVNHQGMLAKVRVDELTVNFEYFIENLEIDSNTCLLILGELEDVQNVGSIIRSAAAFGVSGILVPEHNQAQINGTVVKVSAGTAFSIPLVKIGNINNAIEKLKEERFWIYGLDMFGEKSIYEEKYTEPSVFVIGNEGNGIREKTKESCDVLLHIPISEKVESLNAAVSTAVTISEWRRQKSFTK